MGRSERILRAVAGLALLVCSVLAPLPLTFRLGGFAALGGYLLLTALAGSCLGYRLMGKSSCPVELGR